MRFIFTALILFLTLFVVMRADVPAGQTKPVASQNSREEAERLWEQAIAAKGGRERLYSISNLQISVRDKQWWEFRRVPYEVERLYVFPVREYPKGEESVSFALDRKSHLPRKVIYHTVVFGKEYLGGVSLSDYAALNGVQMPGKVGRDRTIYQFNVDYNKQIFELPPNREAGIEAWKK